MRAQELCIEGEERYMYTGALQDGHSAYYGRLEHAKEGAWIVPSLLSGSDYSGCSVTKANHKTFLEMYGELPGVWDMYGGHGTYAVLIRVDAITEEMAETLCALADYPCIDDEAVSYVETDLVDEAWSNYGASDFRGELRKAYPGTEDRWGRVPDDLLFQAFSAAADKGNVNGGPGYQVETGCSVYFMFDEVFKRTDVRSFVLRALEERRTT